MRGTHYCQAVRCASRATQGHLLCSRHWELVPENLRERILAIDPRGLLFQPIGNFVLEQLELVAVVIEAVAEAENQPLFNYYRHRVTTWRDLISREKVQQSTGGAAGSKDGGFGLDGRERPQGRPYGSEGGRR